MKTDLALAVHAGVPGVHVETERAAVDLRGADLDELHQRLLESTVVDVALKVEHRLVAGGMGLGDIESCVHRSPLLEGSKICGCTRLRTATDWKTSGRPRL